MKKKFIVKTPFGIGVATSEEDLKDMLSFVEGISGEGAEQGEAQQAEEDTPCDCENCQHNAQLSEKRLTVFSDLVVATASPDLLDFMKDDIESDINAATLALGKDHPQVIHLDKMLDLVKERIAELGNPAQEKGIADPIRIIIDKLADALDKDFTSEVAKMGNPTSELMSDEELLERLSIDIEQVNNMEDLTALDCFRSFMTHILGSENPNKRREAELLIGKIDERVTELTGESDADKVEGKTTWGKRNPELLDLDHVSKTVDIGADMLASIDLGYEIDKVKMTNLIRRSIDILDEYLKSEMEKMDSPETPVEDSPTEDVDLYESAKESVLEMTAIEIEGFQSAIENKLDIITSNVNARDKAKELEVEKLKELHVFAESQKAKLKKMDTQETPVKDSPAEELQGKHALSFEAIKAMTDHDEVDKLQIELERKLSLLSDKKQDEIDRIREEMKRIEDLHSAAAAQKAVILDNKADIAHADMADKVKALQEAITRSQPHLLIHDDIREAMEILQERYRK